MYSRNFNVWFRCVLYLIDGEGGVSYLEAHSFNADSIY